MQAKLTDKYNSKYIECDLAIITIEGGTRVHISPDAVLVFIDGFQFAQYPLKDPVPNTKLLPFEAETKRYKPKETAKKMYVPPVQVYFNALADNFINFWRGLLK